MDACRLSWSIVPNRSFLVWRSVGLQIVEHRVKHCRIDSSGSWWEDHVGHTLGTIRWDVAVAVNVSSGRTDVFL